MTQNLTDLNKTEIYCNNEGKTPTAFTITLANETKSTTQAAAQVLINELEEFTNNYKFETADQVFNGKKEIQLSPDMLLMRLEYPDCPARWIVYTFHEEENVTFTKEFVSFVKETVH